MYYNLTMLYKNRYKEHKWDGIPKGPGIYFIFSGELKIVYVGYSSNLRRRMMNHAVPVQPFSREVLAGLFSFLGLPDKDAAQKMEGKILTRMRGTSNKKKLFPAKWPAVNRGAEHQRRQARLSEANKIHTKLRKVQRLARLIDTLLEDV